MQRTHPQQFLKPPVQGAHADRGLGGQRGDGQVLGQPVFDPVQQRRQVGVRGRRGPDDELRLAAGAFQRHDGQAGAVGGDGGAVVALDHVQAQVHAGGGAGGGQDLAVVDEQDVGVDVDGGVAAREQAGGFPVGGGLEAVEDAARGQDEGAGADGGDAGTLGVGVADQVEDVVRDTVGRVGQARDDEGVGAARGVQAVADVQVVGVGADAGFAGVDLHGVGAAAVEGFGELEDLAGDGQVARDEAVEGKHGDAVRGGRGHGAGASRRVGRTAAHGWRISFEDWHFGQWLAIAPARTMPLILLRDAAMPLKDADASTPALFKWAAMLEGVTLLAVLGVAVPLKHLAGMRQGVSWVGPVHGVAFMVYIALACNVASAQGWPRQRLVWTLVATLVPFGGFVIARSLRRGREA